MGIKTKVVLIIIVLMGLAVCETLLVNVYFDFRDQNNYKGEITLSDREALDLYMRHGSEGEFELCEIEGSETCVVYDFSTMEEVSGLALEGTGHPISYFLFGLAVVLPILMLSVIFVIAVMTVGWQQSTEIKE